MELLLSGELTSADQALAIKRTVHKGLAMAWPELEEYGRLLSDELWRTEDHKEGVMSLVEKRKPAFKER